MKEKCKKFEGLFVFMSEQELEEHVKRCPDCKAELEKMERVSELIQEVKPYYINKRQKKHKALQVACLLFVGLVLGTFIGYFSDQMYINGTTAYSDNTVPTINEYGMTLDNYGLITVK